MNKQYSVVVQAFAHVPMFWTGEMLSCYPADAGRFGLADCQRMAKYYQHIAVTANGTTRMMFDTALVIDAVTA